METGDFALEEILRVFGMTGRDVIAVRQERGGVNGGGIAEKGMKSGVWAAIRIDPNHAVKLNISVAGHPSTDENLAIGLEINGPAPAIEARINVESSIPGAVGVEANDAGAG